METTRYAFTAPDYPRSLRELPNPPPVLTTSAPLEEARAVAIVGSREASRGALRFARELAYQLASAGFVVVSGGARGVDGAAHRGALDAGGATWVVCPTGKDRTYPPEHAGLFAEVARSPGSRLIWPFPDRFESQRDHFKHRNGVLVALSEAVVVIQAHLRSGSRNAASWARELRRPLWVVPGAPWMGEFAGSLLDITNPERPAEPLWSAEQLLLALGVTPLPIELVRGVSEADNGPSPPKNAPPRNPRQKAVEPPDKGAWTSEEKLVFSSISYEPMHVDEITSRASLPVPRVVTALLTLSLRDVVVEGPDGFFRRRNAA
ncbi:MAG: DNA-processing protein DprA [Labilithrix sp.]|nr:DNA-processing protein DprA [Labilithrix sp.]